jgi:hypothetical protein
MPIGVGHHADWRLGLDPHLNLGHDRWIRDLLVVRQQKCLAQNNRKRPIALKRQEHLTRPFLILSRHDAEIWVVRLHEDVAAAEVDFVGADVAAHDEEFVLESAVIGG